MMECKAKPTGPNHNVCSLLLPHSPQDTHPALLFIVKSEKQNTANIQDNVEGHSPSQSLTQQPSNVTLLYAFSSDCVSHCHRVRSVDTFVSTQLPSQASYLRKWELDYLRRIRDTCLQCLNAKGAKDRTLTPGNFVCWPITLVNAKCH